MEMTNKTIDHDRLARFEAGTLARGAHQSIEQGACLVEWASYLAGEPWSDRPPCVCPAIGAFARRLNDGPTPAARRAGRRGDGRDD